MRLGKDGYFLTMAELIATRSTCIRRSVGCVLVDARGHVLSTGYNGVAAGLPHCNEFIDTCGPINDPQPFYSNACVGAFPVGGGGLDNCDAVHAEQNALLQCRDVYAIETCYTLLSPCIACLKLLLNTSCVRIVFREEYTKQPRARELWASSPGRIWLKQGEK